MSLRPMRPLRASLCAVIGADAPVKVDRGEGLYVFPAPADAAVQREWIKGLREGGWIVKRAGRLLRAAPGWSHLCAVSAFLDGCDDESARLLARHQGAGHLDGEMGLFLRAVKGYELGMSAGEWDKLDRELRAAAAVSLRTGAGGGGLYGIYRISLAIKGGMER